jgi:hypothetical protein
MEEEETAGIDSIILSQGSRSLYLQKSNKRWYVNKHMYARDKAVRQLMNVLQDLRVEAPARKENRQELLETILSNPIHVKVYDGHEAVRNYLVEDNKYKKGTSYMMMEGSREPFIMGLPGYDGDLAGLYRLDPEYWRDKTLFDYSGLDIKSIKVQYPGTDEASFYLSYNEDSFRLRTLETGDFISDFSSSRAARYFSYFGNVQFDSVIQEQDELVDSLQQARPYCVFEIVDENNKLTKLYTYRKRTKEGEDPFGQNSYYDLNHLYGRFDDVEEILLIKYTEFDPLLKEINYFRENN